MQIIQKKIVENGIQLRFSFDDECNHSLDIQIISHALIIKEDHISVREFLDYVIINTYALNEPLVEIKIFEKNIMIYTNKMRLPKRMTLIKTLYNELSEMILEEDLNIDMTEVSMLF